MVYFSGWASVLEYLKKRVISINPLNDRKEAAGVQTINSRDKEK